jgi:phage gp36-like protein
MTYAVAQDMVNRFGEQEVIQLTDRANVGEIDETVLAGGLESAVSEINTYLAERYALPLPTVPLVLRDFTCDIARYRLCGAGVVETDEIRTRYKDALKFLENVAKGVASLGLDADQQKVPPVGQPKIAADAPVFNRETLKDY